MTPEQEACGYALYGPPAPCTCGTCDADEAEEARRDWLIVLGAMMAIWAGSCPERKESA